MNTDAQALVSHELLRHAELASHATMLISIEISRYFISASEFVPFKSEFLSLATSCGEQGKRMRCFRLFEGWKLGPRTWRNTLGTGIQEMMENLLDFLLKNYDFGALELINTV